MSTGLQTKGSLVRFPVRPHAWVAGQVPSGRRARGNHIWMFLSLSSSLPPPLFKNKQINKILKKRKEQNLRSVDHRNRVLGKLKIVSNQTFSAADIGV